MRGIRVVVVMVVVLSAVGDALLTKRVHDGCQAQELCRECIQTTGCAWCINPLDDTEHCHFADIMNTTRFCNSEDIQNPGNSMNLVQNDELSGSGESDLTNKRKTVDIIQIKPQRVKLQLRIGMKQGLGVMYKRAKDYPVDLYYLMDLSKSMEDDKNTLASLGKKLTETMSNLTSQFTLGFGSFVDKVMMPFTNTTSKTNKRPCAGCAFPYSFRNDMELNDNYAQFQRRVSAAQISGNLDHPEGGFDALMQVMVCKDKIGWRDEARRIVVFSTDAKFHHAGDGRLAGVVEPNDEQCHLNNKNEYAAFDKYDYPSIGQINKVAKEKNINIIFAVLKHESLYRKLSQKIETSSFGLLENGSANVVDLIRDQYNNISSSVILTDNSTSDITIKYKSACKGNVVRETNRCDNIKENDNITFSLEITANKCPENGERSIVEVKTLQDKLILDIDFVCTCNCPQQSGLTRCKNGGSLVCGVCECLDGYYGKECECSSNDYEASVDKDQQAKCMANEDDTFPCSNRGDCKCGVCQCNEPFSGTYCQCNKRKCRGSNGKECSGNGTCLCNECQCHDGYFGDQCNCAKKACIEEGSNEICSGHGECTCDGCQCSHEDGITYTGKYCEECLSCGRGKCGKFKDCVQCAHFANGPLKDNCSACESSVSVESLDEYVQKDFRLCTFEDEEGCYFNFTYQYKADTNTNEVYVQSKRECPEPPPILSIVFSLIGAIVGIGVLSLLLWKVFTHIHDKREYAKFAKERDNIRFPVDENPIFVNPTTTTQNPMFSSQSVK